MNSNFQYNDMKYLCLRPRLAIQQIILIEIGELCHVLCILYSYILQNLITEANPMIETFRLLTFNVYFRLECVNTL